MKRAMIAAPKSGSGKTLITCGLLRLMTSHGFDVTSFKCGPDFIDPMFHRRVLGVPGGNLDSFFSGDDELRKILSRKGHEYAVIEGVMGIYDGIINNPSDRFDYSGSCYEIASITDTPIILVIDAKGMGRTMLSVIKGILEDDNKYLIRGIILNRISEQYYKQISPLISQDLPEYVTLLGGIPSSDDVKLDSRHLGLIMPDEIDDIVRIVDAAAGLIGQYIDTDELFSIMAGAEQKDSRKNHQSGFSTHIESAPYEKNDGSPVLAVARDEAFCFYYSENLRMLDHAGIVLREFSPLHDDKLPENADGILLGGGYPELFAEELSRNVSMKRSVCEAVKNGMPSIAECGGFMYLMDELSDPTGKTWPMCGVVSGRAHYTGGLTRFGYIDITLPGGSKVKGHEFHYSDSDNNGTDAHAVKPGSGKNWDCIHAGLDHLWGFPHLWYPSCPNLITHIADRMHKYHNEKLI